jgi:TPR repeat protein
MQPPDGSILIQNHSCWTGRSRCPSLNSIPHMSALKSSSLHLPRLGLVLLLTTALSGNTSIPPKDPLKDSLDKIRWKAQSSDAYYQGYLGILYRTGYKGVQISHRDSKHWSTLSAQKKHPLGLGNLGAIALWESGSLQEDKSAHKKKVEEARQYYEDAYLNGLFRLGGNKADPLAADLLGDYYFISIPPAPKEMERHYRVAISKGYPRSMAALGFYQMIGGIGIPKNTKEAVYLFEKATKQDLPEGFMNLGVAYMRGDGVPKDLTKARKLILQASERGHEKAKEALARLEKHLKENPHLIGHSKSQGGIDKNLDPESTECLLQARAGNPEAQRKLGLMYWVGKGVPKNINEAKHWLTKAASQGDPIAAKRLALLEKLY